MPFPSGHDCKIFSNSLKQEFKSLNFEKMYLQGITIPPLSSIGFSQGGKLGFGWSVGSPVISPPSSNTSRNNFDKHFGTWPIGRPAISLNLSFLFSSVTISWTWSETLLCKKEYDSSCSSVALWIEILFALTSYKALRTLCHFWGVMRFPYFFRIFWADFWAGEVQGFSFFGPISKYRDNKKVILTL